MISLQAAAEEKKESIRQLLRKIKERLEVKEPIISALADALLQMRNGIHVFTSLAVQNGSDQFDYHSDFEHLQKLLFLLSEEDWQKIRQFDSLFNADVDIEISKLIFDINSKVCLCFHISTCCVLGRENSSKRCAQFLS